MEVAVAPVAAVALQVSMQYFGHLLKVVLLFLFLRP